MSAKCPAPQQAFFVCSSLHVCSVLRRLLEQIVTCSGLLPSGSPPEELLTLFQFHSYLEKEHVTNLEKHLAELIKEGNGRLPGTALRQTTLRLASWLLEWLMGLYLFQSPRDNFLK